jgi:hypothetical protein
VVADVVVMVVSLFGLRTANTKMRDVIMAKTSRTWRYGLRNIGAEFRAARAAGNKTAMARVAVGAFLGMCNVLSVKAVATMIFSTMTKADWVKAGVAFVAQLTLWFGTAGMALVTQQLAMIIYGFVQLGIDADRLARVMDNRAWLHRQGGVPGGVTSIRS